MNKMMTTGPAAMAVLMMSVLFGAFCVTMAARGGMPEDDPLPDHYEGERHNVEFDHEAFLGGKVIKSSKYTIFTIGICL